MCCNDLMRSNGKQAVDIVKKNKKSYFGLKEMS